METRRPLKVGLHLPETDPVVSWQEMQALAKLAEDAGFDSLWVADHLLYRKPDEEPTGPWEAWSVLSALAAVTTRVELGPLVTATSFRNPALLAKIATTVDEISGGRLILGLGAGWNEVEYQAFGFPYDHRIDRFAEAFTIIRTLLREGQIDFAGAYYQARECELVPRGPRPAGPPLLIGSRGPRMLQLTLPYVDIWNAWYAHFDNSLDGLRPLLAKIDAACEAVGRDPATLARSVALLVGMSDSTSETRYGRPLRGTAEELAAEVRRYAAAGVSHVQLYFEPYSRGAIEEFAPVLALLDQG